MSLIYNFFGKILGALYGFCGSYGLAILLFSVFAKVIMIPLTYQQTRSSQVMTALAPTVDIINKKYANNAEKRNSETLKLYQRYNYNPLSGCLPTIIQLPMVFALWKVIREPVPFVFESDAIYQTVSQAFLWITNLSVSPLNIFKATQMSGEFFLSLIIPAASAILTVIQQASLGSGNNQMKSMTMIMNVMVLYMGVTLSQAVSLYWTTQTLFGIVQNWVIKKFFPVKIDPPKIVKKKSSSGVKTVEIPKK
ncbi:MAG: YidC/Oxa1 family membrane protein insertase [Eubacteriaceae bacterium]|nr:YidC/Oxa1 family membrane protein insertase [Eubacteriaceae bacterium]